MKVYVKLFAEVNLGDDLFLKILLERYPEVTFILHARKEYQGIFREFNNLEVYQNKNILKSKSLFRRGMGLLFRTFAPNWYKKRLIKNINENNKKKFDESDIFLSIGGSIFMQPKVLPAYADIEYYKIVNNYFKDKFYLGCNFGPYITDDYREEYRDIFAKANDICFRDKASADIFSDLKNIRVKPDIVFGMDAINTPKLKNSIGFSIISPRNGIDENKYFQKYSELINYYQQKEIEIFLFSFCSKQKDDKTIETILKLLPNTNNITKVYYTSNIESFLKIYSTVEKMYCSRFHSMILSMLYNQKFIPIIYSEKMTNVLKDIRYKGYSCKIEDFYKQQPEELNSKFSTCTYDISNQILESNKQFEKLDSILKENTI